jgi:hypothetical protein
VKRLAAAVTVTAALGILAAPATAASYDTVKGLGVIGPSSFNVFALGAFSAPDGSNPSGTASVVDPTLRDGTPKRAFVGRVDCLKVTGKLAVMVVTFTHLFNRPSFDGALIIVADNGRPRGWTSPDRIGIRDFTGAAPSCPDPGSIAPPNGVVRFGDIAVHDAT